MLNFIFKIAKTKTIKIKVMYCNLIPPHYCVNVKLYL